MESRFPDGAAGSRPVSRAVTAELLSRYDRPGPRYTSYPTAVEFDERVDARVYAERLALADPLGDAPLSLYVHLPFCRNRCLFCGCNVIITPHQQKALPYLDLLRKEIDLVAERLPSRRRFSQLHLGGGTPTYFEPAALREVLEHLFTYFAPTPGAELAVEVDPRVTTDDHVDMLAALGFNRISLGVQDFTPEVQQAIDRVQSVEQTAGIIRRARERGYRGINVDLIYGLPHQTPETFEHTVERVIELGADRTAVYSFAYLPSQQRGHQKRIDDQALPDAGTKVKLFALARERFLAAGYEPIGMDHFARHDDELALARREGRLRRNFQGYSVIPAEDVLGLGVSAIGDVRGAYVQNCKKLSQYGEALDAGRLPVDRGVCRSPDDEIRRGLIHGLMCNFVVDIPRFEARWGIAFADYFAADLARLRPLQDEGLAVVTDDEVRATPVGELFIRNLAMCFDRYWWARHEGRDQQVFSRTL